MFRSLYTANSFSSSNPKMELSHCAAFIGGAALVYFHNPTNLIQFIELIAPIVLQIGTSIESNIDKNYYHDMIIKKWL